MVYQNEKQIFDGKNILEKDGKIQIKNSELFRKKTIDDVIDTIILTEDHHLKRLCYWLAYEAAIQLGVIPSSIQGLYEAMGKGKVTGFTVPAMNLRTLTYDLARAIFRAANKIDAGAFIFEIAKSEIGYTDQRPLEYSSVIMLAALRENYKSPIFVQGDHFQVKAKSFLQDKNKEINPLKDLIKEAI